MNTLQTITNDPALPDYRGSVPARERVLLLGLIYLQAGLPPEAAYRSALADYVCGFDDTALLVS